MRYYHLIGPVMYLIRAIQLLALLLVLQGCATTTSKPVDMILGSWQSTVGGFEVMTIYTATEVAVDGHEALPYRMAGDELTIDGDVTTRRVINFPTRTEMIQVDVITGTEHRLIYLYKNTG